MPKLKLTYFDFHGGRGEPARMALRIAGVPFEDDRVPLAAWPERKAGQPFGAVPVLRVDDYPLTQSNTINRYVGELSGLYPTDSWQAALCDEAMGLAEDIATRVVATFGIQDPEEMRAAREALVSGPLSADLRGLEKRLERSGGEWFADGRLTVADLKVAVQMASLRSGVLDHIPTDLAERVAPGLVRHRRRVEEEPRVAAYLKARGS